MIDTVNADAVRGECKRTIENLEIWLRNLVDNEMSPKYGDNYLNHSDEKGVRLFKKDIVKDALDRVQNNPGRYPRIIDAMLLDDIITVVCHPNIYKTFSKDALSLAYPFGEDEARMFLSRLIPIRNKLYHSNPITNREAEKVFCYSNDVIDSIKEYYKRKNLETKYNAPMIIRIADSFGNQFGSTQIIRNSTGRGGCLTESELYPGDTLTIQVEVDPSFSPNEYSISWVFYEQNKSTFEENHNMLVLWIENRHVRMDFSVSCLVTSNKDWHRCGDVDDAVSMHYKVIPRSH